MKLRISKLDLISSILLVLLVAFECYFDRKHFFGSVETFFSVAIGLVIGVNIGFKIGAMHISHISNKLFDNVEACELKLTTAEDKKNKTERELKMALDREMKLRQTLARNLKERDDEVKMLFDKFTKKNVEA